MAQGRLAPANGCRPAWPARGARRPRGHAGRQGPAAAAGRSGGWSPACFHGHGHALRGGALLSLFPLRSARVPSAGGAAALQPRRPVVRALGRCAGTRLSASPAGRCGVGGRAPKRGRPPCLETGLRSWGTRGCRHPDSRVGCALHPHTRLVGGNSGRPVAGVLADAAACAPSPWLGTPRPHADGSAREQAPSEASASVRSSW